MMAANDTDIFENMLNTNMKISYRIFSIWHLGL